MQFQEDEAPRSMLEEIHLHFLNASKSFKDLVCLQCDFSTATYYRKVISSNSTILSKAEEAKVLESAEYVVDKIQDCIKSYKKN